MANLKWKTVKRGTETPSLDGVEIEVQWVDEQIKELVLIDSTGRKVRIVSQWDGLSMAVPEPPKMQDRYVVTVSGGGITNPARHVFESDSDASQFEASVLSPFVVTKTIESVMAED